MFDYLIKHALQHVWCSPKQDLQVIFKPAKINRNTGSIVSANHLWSRIDMPTTTGYFHLYQIGQLTPYLIGLLPDRLGWVKLSDVMQSEKLIIDLYTNDGLHLPCGTSWYRFTDERNLIVAVEDQPTIADLRTDPIYIRLYSNSYFASTRAEGWPQAIVCRYAKMTDVTVGSDFQYLYHQHRDKPHGHTKLFVNGAYVKDFVPTLTPIGSTLEFVYDSSIKMVVDYPLADVPSFDSDLDLKRKYLMHYQGPQTDGPVIDYRDDVDVYLIRPYLRGTVPTFEGVYYHKNQDDAMRMVTHRDYTLTVPYVTNYQLARDGWDDVHDLTARLFVRYSGWQRPLILEHGHIHDLYKLPPEDILPAMHGTDATVSVWQAHNLENSYYPKIMDATGFAITAEMVQKAYGYNAISILMANTPQFIENVNGRRQVSLPPGLHANSTVYEYNADGLLIDSQYHALGAEYTPMHPQTRMVEALVGRARTNLPYTKDTLTQTIDPTLNYRCYHAVRVGDTILNDTWQDVTDDESKVAFVGDQLSWSVNLLNFTTLVINDLDFVGYNLDLSPTNGLLKFSVGYGTPLQYIPPGKIDVWLNGHALIETIDYRVQWPQIVVFNKEFLTTGTNQKLSVRCTGFCQSDLSREEPAERGWIKHGQVSRNALFNLRDDKILRIVVRGLTYDRSELEFVETDDGQRLPEEMNGYPYQIENVVVPLRGLVDGEDTYSYRAKSMAVDTEVADYLNLRLPEPVEPNPNLSLERYAVYSPFSSTIIHDIINGVIDMVEYQGHYSNQDVLERLEEYRYLLDYDPTQFPLNDRFMIVHPHNLLTEVRVDLYQYNFISRAVHLFLDDKVDLSRFLVIT